MKKKRKKMDVGEKIDNKTLNSFTTDKAPNILHNNFKVKTIYDT